MTELEPGPGRVLRAEREKLGVTVREVSETLNLSMTVIEALEADDYDRLPGPVFTRGYVRSYARLLELDPEPLMHQVSLPEARADEPEAPREPAVREWIRQRPALVLGAAGAAVIVLLVLLAIWLWPGGGAAHTDAGGLPRVDTPATGSAALRERPDSRVAQLRGAPAREAGTGAAAAGAKAQPGAEGVQRLTPGGDDRLKLSFSDECWVEIRDADGASLYSELNEAGSEVELEGEGVFRILLGYAPGVRLEYNGEPVPLGPHTRNNVANLVVGQ
ncbi:MAG: helix-turn-helix domain-containing protein [Pseudomonadota bacterium]